MINTNSINDTKVLRDPHAVTKVGDVTYSYDANGNMTGDSSGRTINWNRFNKPTLLAKGDSEIRFDYGAAR